MSFSDRLHEVIREKGCSQYRIAKDLNISASTISNYLKGETHPDMTKLEVLSRYLGVNRPWLLTGEGEKYRVTNVVGDQQKNNIAEQSDLHITRLISILEKHTDSLRERDHQITRLIDMNGLLLEKFDR